MTAMTVDKGISIKNIYYMLSYAFDIKRLRQEDYKRAAGEEFDNIYDLFAAILEKGVSQQIKQGLYREYVPMQEELPLMRGKPDISETMRLRVQRKQKLSCRFDEFSQDDLYNQILKITIQLLSRADGVSEKRRQALRRLDVNFCDVSLIQPRNIAWDRIMYRRGNRSYELLLNICRLVLIGLLQTTEDGSYKLLSFTDENMAKLYEKFILEYYKQEHRELDAKAAQVKWNFTAEPDKKTSAYLPQMNTDITLQKGDKKLIIDAKYYRKMLVKNYSDTNEKLRSAHMYQIFTYVKNMDTNNTGNVSGLLLYAKTEDELFPDGEPFEICGNSIGAKTLDLSKDFEEIASQLDKIAEYYFPHQT